MFLHLLEMANTFYFVAKSFCSLDDRIRPGFNSFLNFSVTIFINDKILILGYYKFKHVTPMYNPELWNFIHNELKVIKV